MTIQAHARAMSSELQLVMMERDYAALKGEVASLSAAVHKERGAAQAAQETAQGAVRQLHSTELHYRHLVQRLEEKLHATRVRGFRETDLREINLRSCRESLLIVNLWKELDWVP